MIASVAYSETRKIGERGGGFKKRFKKDKNGALEFTQLFNSSYLSFSKTDTVTDEVTSSGEVNQATT